MNQFDRDGIQHFLPGRPIAESGKVRQGLPDRGEVGIGEQVSFGALNDRFT